MEVKNTTELGILICICVHCLLAQTFPYVSFDGQTLANHSYVDLSLVGNDDSGSDSVQCHTDLSTCCRRTDGAHRGDWYFPNGTRLPFQSAGGIIQKRDAERVDMSHINSNTDGIYRCDIPTNAVHDDTDISVRTTAYVGLYPSSGELSLCHSAYLITLLLSLLSLSEPTISVIKPLVFAQLCFVSTSQFWLCYAPTLC